MVGGGSEWSGSGEGVSGGRSEWRGESERMERGYISNHLFIPP